MRLKLIINYATLFAISLLDVLFNITLNFLAIVLLLEVVLVLISLLVKDLDVVGVVRQAVHVGGLVVEGLIVSWIGWSLVLTQVSLRVSSLKFYI